jgi:hypothetical protein
VKVEDPLDRILSAIFQPLPPEDLPTGVRSGIHRLAALLTSPTWDEVMLWSTALNADLRDLNERELAHLEAVSLKVVQRWRTEGTGPAYRNRAGIRYSLRDVWEWRCLSRQTTTAQGIRRGNRHSEKKSSIGSTYRDAQHRRPIAELDLER